MHSIDLLMRSMPLLLTSGGKDQFIASFVFLPTPWHGRGSNGEGERSCKGCVNLFGLSMTMHVCVLVVHGLFMKVLRYALMAHLWLDYHVFIYIMAILLYSILPL